LFKGQCHEIFCFRIFHESSSPKPLKTALQVHFEFVRKFAEIFASQGAPPFKCNRKSSSLQLNKQNGQKYSKGSHWEKATREKNGRGKIKWRKIEGETGHKFSLGFSPSRAALWDYFI
jgi:hypothetical protein